MKKFNITEVVAKKAELSLAIQNTFGEIIEENTITWAESEKKPKRKRRIKTAFKEVCKLQESLATVKIMLQAGNLGFTKLPKNWKKTQAARIYELSYLKERISYLESVKKRCKQESFTTPAAKNKMFAENEFSKKEIEKMIVNIKKQVVKIEAAIEKFNKETNFETE